MSAMDRRHDTHHRASTVPPDRLAAAEARVAALEARVAVAEAEARSGGAALELLRDLTARFARLEEQVEGRVDETVISRADAAKLLGISPREITRLARTEPALMDCAFRPGGHLTHMKYVRRKLLAYRDQRG